MSVHQLKDGRWICRHPIGIDPERPTANKKYFGRGLEAERAAKEYDFIVLNKRKPVQSSPLFTDLVNEYLTAKGHTMAASEKVACIDKMRRVILPEIGLLMAHELSPEKLEKYTKERTKDGVKRTTIHREISYVRAVLRWSVRRKLLSSNPMEGYDMPTRDDALIQPPTAEEFAAILKCASPHLQRAMLLAYHTGLRPGKEELFSLRWGAVDFIGKTITVISAVKGGLPRRIIPLNKTILSHLSTWYDQDIKTETQYIVHYHGAKVDSLKTAWSSAKRRAKVLRRIRLYDIRHAFITNLLELGADLKSVSEIAGHASPDMTMRVYQHVSSDLKRKAVDLLD